MWNEVDKAMVDLAMRHELLRIARVHIDMLEALLRPFVEVSASFLTTPRQPVGHIILRNHTAADPARGVTQEQVDHACRVLPYTLPISRIVYGPTFHRHMGTTRGSAVTTAVEEAAPLDEAIGLTPLDELQKRAAELEDAIRPFVQCAHTHLVHGKEGNDGGVLWVSASGTKPRSVVTWQHARRACDALPDLLELERA